MTVPEKAMFLAWVNYHDRSAAFASQLGMPVHFISYGRRSRPLQLPWRYLRQSWQTIRLLLRHRPSVVLMQNPPILLPLLVYIYSRLRPTKYVIDSHTGAFLSPTWSWTLPVHRLVSRHAVTTIVTNRYLQSVVEGWGARASIIGYSPGEYPPGKPFPFPDGFNVVIISGFEWDEPLVEMFEAAAKMPDINFFVSGESSRADASLLRLKPANLTFTGYLPFEEYIGLLRGCHLIMDLTKVDHTLLMGGFEAVSLEVPLLTSDWQVLKDCFSLGTIHVPNTTDGIIQGLRQAQEKHVQLRGQMGELRKKLTDEWNAGLRQVQALLDA
jgi:hypothetical protein